jgi:hypothetical protein
MSIASMTSHATENNGKGSSSIVARILQPLRQSAFQCPVFGVIPNEDDDQGIGSSGP